MEEYVEIAGAGRLRTTTAQDVSRALETRSTASPIRKAVTASASRMSTRSTDTAYYRRISSPWQYRALSYYDQIGEVRFASQFYAKLLSRVRFYPATLEEDGSTTPITSGPPVNLLNRIQDPGGGRTQIQYDYGRLMFVTGEGALFGSFLNTDAERWKFLWKDELKPVGDGLFMRLNADKSDTDEIGVAYRLWTPHPRQSDEADSPLRPVWEICVARGSLVSTPTGARRIEEIQAGDEVYAWRAGKMVTRRVSMAASTGENETLKVVAGRRTIQCTPEHRLLIAKTDKPGKGRDAKVWTEWVRAIDLARGDYLVVPERIPSQAASWILPDGTQGSEDVAYLLGQVCGDGHITDTNVQIATFNAARDLELAGIVERTWGLTARPRKGSIIWYSTKFARLLSLLGLRCPAPEKRIPPIVWQMPDIDKRAFLRGYEDADGHLTPRGWQSHATSSPELARELRHLYIELGENVSNISIEERPAEGMRIAGNVMLTTAAKPLHRFQVYYGSKRRGAKEILRTEKQRAVIGKGFTLARVKRVESAGVVETFDLTVPGASCFFADGVVAHNCEELIILTASVRGTAVSRMTAGLLTMPQEISPAPAEPIGDEDPLNNPFLDDYVEHTEAQIEDPGSAASKVPFLLEGSYEYLDGIRWIETHNPATDYMERDLRVEAIKRLGLSLDFNPEFLLGMTDANHWTAQQVVHDQWRTHGVGVARRFGNDVNQVYLRPGLREEGYADWQKVVIAMDDSQVVLSPDRTADADLAYDRGLINDEAYYELKGLEPSMAATELNKKINLAIKLKEPGFLDGTPYEVKAPKPVAQQPGPTASPSTNGNASDGPAPPAQGRTGSRQESMRASAEILGAAKLSLRRCREVAGSRLRRAQQKCSECQDATDGKPNTLVASILGPEQVVKLGIKDTVRLVQGGADGLKEMLLENECDPVQADSLAQMLEVYAAKTLFDTHPSLPAGFVASVERALEMNLAVEH